MVRDLEAFGFELNPYDPCSANKMVNASQITVVWHIYELKVSYIDSFEIAKFACYVDKIYGVLAVKIGKLYNYLGVDLYIYIDGKVQVSMIHYVNNILRYFQEHLRTTSVSLDADHLFKSRYEEEAQPLHEEQVVVLYHVVAQLLLLSSRARREIHTAFAFLTTRFKQSDEDDWGKLNVCRGT